MSFKTESFKTEEEYKEACYNTYKITEGRPFNDEQRAVVVIDEDTEEQVWSIACNKGGEEILNEVNLAAAHFPPGTQIIIHEPTDEEAISWYGHYEYEEELEEKEDK